MKGEEYTKALARIQSILPEVKLLVIRKGNRVFFTFSEIWCTTTVRTLTDLDDEQLKFVLLHGKFHSKIEGKIYFKFFFIFIPVILLSIFLGTQYQAIPAIVALITISGYIFVRDKNVLKINLIADEVAVQKTKNPDAAIETLRFLESIKEEPKALIQSRIVALSK
ncbi:hypothetical protein CCB80_05240 [Armatimonadetes bacterium Uphvl-Ar1]|nr:hypothetical protein CCB80_05240 [Armatimonadetes bacterium Uphvl-Ar1]